MDARCCRWAQVDPAWLCGMSMTRMLDNAWFMGADLRTKPAKRDALEIAEAGALYPARRTSVAR
jgi:hypothetical protein